MKLPEKVTVTVTMPEIDVIFGSMGKQPYEMVADLIAKMRAQVMEQVNLLNHPPAAPHVNKFTEDEQTIKAGGTD